MTRIINLNEAIENFDPEEIENLLSKPEFDNLMIERNVTKFDNIKINYSMN